MTQSPEKDGGPAFPHGNPTDGGQLGMTLRDWFAGQALVGIEAAQGNDGEYISAEEQIAKRAFRLADEMLRARTTKDESQ